MTTVDRLTDQEGEVCALPEVVVPRYGRYRIRRLPTVGGTPASPRPLELAVESCCNGFSPTLCEALHSLVQRDRGPGRIKGQGLATSKRERCPGGWSDPLCKHCPDPATRVAGTR